MNRFNQLSKTSLYWNVSICNDVVRSCHHMDMLDIPNLLDCIKGSTRCSCFDLNKHYNDNQYWNLLNAGYYIVVCAQKDN